ncbi:MAG: hypothetical protein VX460_14675, partial [Planctomycetota bacterium]|nr:hypothetical protein [Planctomycetota bacterium]
MVQPLIGFVVFALGIVVVAMAPVVAAWLIVQALKLMTTVLGGGARIVGGAIQHVARFVIGVIADTLRLVGSAVTALIVLPLAAANLALFRLAAARHYGAAVEDELMNALGCAYRVVIGRPVRFLGLGALTEGLERRLPELFEEEPMTGDALAGSLTGVLGRGGSGPRPMAKRAAQRPGAVPTFEGYDVLEELRAGGSGARLFVAAPTAAKAALWRSRSTDAPAKVVIKAFALGYGSTLPQIVRESRSLEAAKRLGLVLDHTLEEDAFHYVMPFVPGEDLDVTTRRLHAASRGEGLDVAQLRAVLGFARDLCDHLTRFHDEGLWHKDIKPSNLMVEGDRLRVVDLGLVTPLESPLTLTTHGTEFFRDPELVRLAIAGRRVRDVDGVKFDLYSAGAVIYSMVENSFPAHGSLSSITKPAPGALRWIVRRAMADIDKRYESAEELGRDLDVLLAAKDPNEVRPADLPSVDGAGPPPRIARVVPPPLHGSRADLPRRNGPRIHAEPAAQAEASGRFASAKARRPLSRHELAREAREDPR